MNKPTFYVLLESDVEMLIKFILARVIEKPDPQNAGKTLLDMDENANPTKLEMAKTFFVKNLLNLTKKRDEKYLAEYLEGEGKTPAPLRMTFENALLLSIFQHGDDPDFTNERLLAMVETYEEDCPRLRPAYDFTQSLKKPLEAQASVLGEPK
jgi:hypothetical protein